MATPTAPDTEGKRLRPLAAFVVVAVVLLLGLSLWLAFVEVFAFGAIPGQQTNTSVQPVPVVQSIDEHLIRMPLVGPIAQDFLKEESTAPGQGEDAGPQAVWRSYVKGWGALMVLTAFLMLLIKRLVEDVNSETTTMHLKGDTDTALRAKGGRG